MKGSGALGRIWQRKREVGEFIAGLWLAIVLTVVTWYAEGFQDHMVKQWTLSVLYFVWPFGILAATIVGGRPEQSPKGNQPDGGSLPVIGLFVYYGFILSMTVAAAALLSLRSDWDSLPIGLALIWPLTLVLPIFGYLVYRKLILGVALVPAVVTFMIADAVVVLRSEGDWVPTLALSLLLWR